MISILACARWGILTRAQRIVHILTLCMVIFALAAVKTILKESDIYAYGNNYYHYVQIGKVLTKYFLASMRSKTPCLLQITCLLLSLYLYILLI